MEIEERGKYYQTDTSDQSPNYYMQGNPFQE